MCQKSIVLPAEHPIDIPGLHRIQPSQQETACRMMIRAFRKYPKLLHAFPEEASRLAAIEAVVRYYAAYDFCYGAGFSLDEGIHECAVMMHSDEFDFGDPVRIAAADCENAAWQAAMERLTPQQRATWHGFFEELDREEAKLDLPQTYLYIDFVAVEPEYQHQGRGRRLLQQVINWSSDHDLPIMLFTNGEYDIRFYQSLGFEIAGVTTSDTYGFENTYVTFGA
ncbi:MAG: GNAT family N-acetyltransferase [Firmicutes bacterium]|nr:GNAT family N-acetyltransferase [Bacillota bacterium]